MDLSNTSQVTLHTYSGALAITPQTEAEAEREALEGLFQMSLETEGQLSDAMNGTITSMENANRNLMGRFQEVSTVNDTLNARIIAVTAQVTQLTHAAQAHQEAHEAQIQRMQAQIAQLEQEKAEMLLQRNEEVATVARFQEEIMRVTTETARAQIEALHLTHAANVAALETTHSDAIATLVQINASATASLTTAHTNALTVLQRQLMQSIHDHQTALQNVAHKEAENKLLVEENEKMKPIVNHPMTKRFFGIR